MPDPLVLAGTLLEDIDGTGPATHINAMTLGIDEYIIRIAAGIEVGNHRVIRGRQDEQPRWASEHDEHSVSILVEGHRKIAAMVTDPQLAFRLRLKAPAAPPALLSFPALNCSV
jgi:hypothetical protein